MINGICQKCGYRGDVIFIMKKSLCNVCSKFAPNKEGELKQYVSEKTNWKTLNLFRKYVKFAGERQKEGMIKKARDGMLMSRAPFGYKIIDKKLIPGENARQVEDIFEEFLKSDISLRKLSKKHGFSVNGLKKILRNFTYIGKIKFNNEINEGHHKEIISSTLFNHVQNKLEKLGIKKS